MQSVVWDDSPLGEDDELPLLSQFSTTEPFQAAWLPTCNVVPLSLPATTSSPASTDSADQGVTAPVRKRPRIQYDEAPPGMKIPFTASPASVPGYFAKFLRYDLLLALW